MNENTLTGFYLNRLLLAVFYNENGQKTTLLNEIYQQNGNDWNKVRDRLQGLLEQNSNLLNYSDEVGRELMDKQTGVNGYQQTANFVNNFAHLMGAKSNLDSSMINQLMHTKSNVNLPAQILNDEQRNQRAFATLFNRQNFSDPVIRDYFVRNFGSNNGFYSLDNRGNQMTYNQFIMSVRALDSLAQRSYADRLFGLITDGSLPANYQPQTTTNEQIMLNSQLVRQKEQQKVTTAQANAQSENARSQVNAQAVVNRQVTNQIVDNQTSQTSYQRSTPQNQPDRDTVSLPFGLYEIGAISRDDVLLAPTYYTPRFYNDPTHMMQSMRRFNRAKMRSEWNYHNGKYQWRKPDVAANSPVTVQELTDALGPFFSTPNMESKFHDVLMDNSGDDRNKLYETVTANVITTDGENAVASAKQRINKKKDQANAIYKVANQAANEHGGNVEADGETVRVDVLKHNGHLFSPSDVAKAQFILKTAQDAGLDYDIRPGRNGQIVLKVNDNRGMQVTLLDIDNPSNIGTTRDRSGNEYAVDWTNVTMSDGQNKRPVFAIIDNQGRIVSDAKLDKLALGPQRDSQLYAHAISSQYTDRYLVNFSYGGSRNRESDFEKLIQSYQDPNSKMDPGLRKAIQAELAKDQSYQKNPNDSEIFNHSFRQAVSRAMRADGMRAYESLPTDYQNFMAAVPMIEALGIDTNRLNSFQDLAKKYHYTAENVVNKKGRINSHERLERIITPTAVDNNQDTATAVYNPNTKQFDQAGVYGLNLAKGQKLSLNATAGVEMRDSLYVNHTNQANDYTMPPLMANNEIGQIYHNARVNMLNSLINGQQSSDDQTLNDLLDRYQTMTSEVLAAHHLSFKQDDTKELLAKSYAYVADAVQKAQINSRGINVENYQDLVANKIENDDSLTDSEKEAAQDYAEKLYRFINNETGTAMLQVHDEYDHSPAHVTELEKAETDKAKAELKAMNWYQEYGHHAGDQEHIYLDTLQEFTISQEPNAIRYSFDLVNYAKQTTPDLYQSFAGHNAVNSKLIQQRMVNFDNDNMLYLSQLTKGLNPNRFDYERSKNDWMLTEFNLYMLNNNQPIDLNHLDEQYQDWLKHFNNVDVTRDITSSNKHNFTLVNGRIINEDGEVIDSLPDSVPADWKKYFAGGKIMNPQSTSQEEINILSHVADSLEKAQVIPDYVNVNVKNGKAFSQNQFINQYVDAMRKQGSDKLAADLQAEAAKVFQSKIDDGSISPAIAIDKNGLVHWKGHTITATNSAAARQLTEYVKAANSSDPAMQAKANRLASEMASSHSIRFNPVEGTLGQFFVPDRRFIINTNYHTFDNLSDEDKAAVQDHEVAGWKAVIQAPRELNQRGDLNPDDLVNFNMRLVLSSLPQVLRREIDENIRMQTAQLPLVDDGIAYKDNDPLAVMLSQMHSKGTKNFGFETDANGRLTSDHFSADVLRLQMNQWLQDYVVNNGDNLSPQDLMNRQQLFAPVLQRDAQGRMSFKPDFVQTVVGQLNPVDGTINYDDRILARRDFTRPEDSTIVNKVYSQEMASTKIKPLPNGQTIFDSNGDNVRDQEIRNKSLLHLHARYRINNGPGEATSTRNVLNDMQEIEDATAEWKALHPGKAPYSDKYFEWAIKNRVHSRVQFFGGTNLGVLATKESLGYADLISTSQGKAQGRVRFLPEGSIVLPSGHVVPAEVPVLMTKEEQAQYDAHQNNFATMKLTRLDPETGELKTQVYKMSRFLDGTPLTKDQMFKYLSTLPFDRSFIAIEQAAKANYIDQDATLALLNANLMNMEDGSVVSKEFAQKHMVYTPDGKLRPLEPGDKLSDTSGDKTTITQVIDPDMSMEEANRQGIGDIVQFMKTTHVDIIKSPLSQISRKNMSQVQDMIDSFSSYNQESVKIHLPKRVEKEFTDANGHHYKVGDLMPELDANNRPVLAEPSQAERDAGLEQKPILTDWADHRKSIAELKKENDNWLKFMNEGGPKAFADGHKFVDVDGEEQKSWPSHPVFAYNVTTDNNGKRVFSMRPALSYQMSDQTIDTGATIGNVTSFVTDILVDAKGNNYGIDPDATTEGRKYSDLVANADASRNATALTQYLTSVDSDALPDFREYLKLAGFELSPDGKVFAANLNRYQKAQLKQAELAKALATQGQNINTLDDLMETTGLSTSEINQRLKSYRSLFKTNDEIALWLQNVNLKSLQPADANYLAGLIKADQQFEHDYNERMQIIDDQINHPGEHRDVFTIDNTDDLKNSDDLLRAVQDANSRTNPVTIDGQKVKGVWDVVSPLPPLVGQVDDPLRNAHVVSSHQVLTDPSSTLRIDYMNQVLAAMDQQKGMQKFNSAADAMNLYVRGHSLNIKDQTKRQNRIKAVQKQSMLIKNGRLSKEQLATIGPILDKIGIDMSSERSSFADGLNTAPGIVAVPDLNGVQRKDHNGNDIIKTLQQMNPGKEFMELIEGSNGGSLQLPDGLTVSLAGNPASHTISILPQDLRRSRQSQANGTTTIDDYTRDYAQIGVAIKRYQVAMKALEITMPPYPEKAFANHQAFEDYRNERAKYLNATKQEIWKRTGVQDAVDRIQDRMMTSTFGKDAGTIKKNFVREHIMSNRIKSSSTAVQSNGYNLPVDTIEVSPEILKSLGMKYDSRTGYAYSPNPNDPKDRSWDMVHMHRDPVWRAHGSLGFRVKVNPSITGVRISPVVVSLMDGDFDGDTIGLIACADADAQKELHNQVNVLANVYDQPSSEKLGSTDMNVSGELIDLAGRSGFNMDMAKSFGGKMPASILQATGTKDADWQFGPVTKNVQDENGTMTTQIDSQNVAKLYAMAQKLYPNDDSLKVTTRDKNGNLTLKTKEQVLDDGTKVQVPVVNVKKAMKTYYALGLDVANRTQHELLQSRQAMDEATPRAGQMQWLDLKNVTNTFINNTNQVIRTGNDAQLAGAGINAQSKETAKAGYKSIINRGAKGSPDALAEMFSDRYIDNKPLYNPEMQQYADQIKAFRDRIMQSYPEAMTVDKNGSLAFHLEKVTNDEDRKSLSEQFKQLQTNYLNPENRKFFDSVDKDTTKELANLAMVQDATKEKSDLTGEPGGWHKKLVAAMADYGPDFLAAANLLGYKMTQATLQVKHDPVLAHKLADLEVNGMSRVYSGQYETRPLMLGLVGSTIVKSGPNLIVPLGNNIMTAGVNQRILLDFVDRASKNKDVIKRLYPDDPLLLKNDFSFHRLYDVYGKEGLQKVAQSLAYFAPQDANGHKMDLNNLSDEDAVRLAEGFDQATRPMLSTWDPETGEQLDSKPDRYEDYGNGGSYLPLTEKGLRASLDELFTAGGVGKPNKRTADMLVATMTETTDQGTKIISITSAAKAHAGTMMSAKSNGFSSIRDTAIDNTKKVLSGQENETTSIFNNDNVVVSYQTRKQRIRTLSERSNQATDIVIKELREIAKTNAETKAGVLSKNTADKLRDVVIGKGDYRFTNQLANFMKTDKQLQTYLKAEKDPRGPFHSIAGEVIKLGHVNNETAAKLDQAKDSRTQYVKSMCNYVLSQNHISTTAKDWKKAAAKVGYSPAQIKRLDHDLNDVAVKAAKQYDEKPMMWEDKKNAPTTQFMNVVFTPIQFDNGESSADAVRRSQQAFANNPAVNSLLETNAVIMKAVKEKGMTIGGLQRVSDGNHNLSDQVKVAKHNCQRILNLQISDNREHQKAFKAISKAVSESDALGKFSYSNRFGNLLRSTVNDVSLAQKQLAVDPTVHDAYGRVDSQKISSDDMKDFKKTTNALLTKMALTKEGKDNQKVDVPEGPTDPKPTANKQHGTGKQSAKQMDTSKTNSQSKNPYQNNQTWFNRRNNDKTFGD